MGRIKERSPFTPGHIVDPTHFFGRSAEVDLLRRGLMQTSKGKLQTYFITGERGMGKSSLAYLVKSLGKKDYDLVGAHAFVGGAESNEEVVRRLFESLLTETKDSSFGVKVKDFLGNHVKEVGLYGINLTFTPSKNDLESLTRNVIQSLKALREKLGTKGLVLIVDDINGIAENPQFANYLKSIVDQAATIDGETPIMLILVGLPSIRQKLLAAQPSVGRIFEVVEIRQLSSEDTHEFFRNMFHSVDMDISAEALKALTQFSGGYPMLLHEIGDSVFWNDKDWHIDMNDAMSGISEAARRVGEKYLETQVYSAIRSANYHSIIRKMVDGNIGSSFTKTQVEKLLSPDEKKVFHNFLKKMKDLGVLRSGENQGEYHYSNELYRLYIGMTAQRGMEQETI